METKHLAIDLELLRLSEAKILYSLLVVEHIQLLLQQQVILLKKMSLFVKNHLVVKNLIRIVSFEKSKTRLLLLQKRIKTFIVKEKLHK